MLNLRTYLTKYKKLITWKGRTRGMSILIGKEDEGSTSDVLVVKQAEKN